MIYKYPRDDFRREANILRSFFPADVYGVLQRLDAMIAGGTLTSLFSNREVNDLDIYFRSWDDLEIFVAYMHDKQLLSGEHDLTVHTMGWNKYKRTYRRFKKLDGIDLATHPFKIASTKSIRDQLDGCAPEEGGEEVSRKIREMFGMIKPFDETEDHASHIKMVGMTDKSVMYSMQSGPVMQVIGFSVFETPEEIFAKFDYTINMGAFCFKTEEWHVDNQFMKHLAQKVLVVNPATDYPIISLLRAAKYEARGYTISRREAMKLGLAMTKLEISSWEDAKKHLSGMYGTNVETLFNEERPFSFELLFDKLDTAGEKTISMIATDKEKGDRAKINHISLEPVGQFTVLNTLRYHTGRPHYSKMWGVCKSKDFYLLEPEKSRQKIHVGMTNVDSDFHHHVELFFDEEDARGRYEQLGNKPMDGGAVLLQVDILNLKHLHQIDHDTGSVNMNVKGGHVKRTEPSAVIRKYIESNGDFT